MEQSNTSKELYQNNLELLKRIKGYKKQIVNLNELISRIDSLNSFSEILESKNSPQELLEELKAELDKFHEVKLCSVFLLNECELDFDLAYQFPSDKQNEALKLYYVLVKNDVFGWTLKQHKVLYLPYSDFIGDLSQVNIEQNKTLVSVIPLRRGVKIYGFLLLEIFNKNGIILNEEQILFSVIFKHFSLSFGNTLYLDLLNKKNLVLKKFKQKVSNELNSAKKVQQKLIGRIPEIENIKVYSFYKPVEKVGGDFFDIIKITERRFITVMADISGHGVPAALGTSALKSALYSNMTNTRRGFQKNVELLLKSLKGVFSEEQYATVFIGEFDVLSRNLKYYSFGHFPGVYFDSRKNSLSLLEANQILIGVFDINKLYSSSVKFNKGDRFLLFTDGVAESYNKYEEMYGFDRLLKRVKKNRSGNILLKIYQDIEKFVGGEQFDDDIAMLQVDIL